MPFPSSFVSEYSRNFIASSQSDPLEEPRIFQSKEERASLFNLSLRKADSPRSSLRLISSTFMSSKESDGSNDLGSLPDRNSSRLVKRSPSGLAPGPDISIF